MEYLIYPSAYAIVAVAYAISMRGTLFAISPTKGFLGGIWIVRELFLLVLLGTVIFGISGTSNFNVVYLKDHMIPEISATIFFSVSLLIISIGFFSKTIFSARLRISFNMPATQSEAKSFENKKLIRSTATVLAISIAAAHIGGTVHAFYEAVFSGQDLLTTRLANRYESDTPTHVVAFINYSSVLLSLLLGLWGRKSIGKFEFFIYVLAAIYSTTLFGNKAFVVNAILLYVMGSLAHKRFTSKSIAATLTITSLVVMWVSYQLVKIQNPDLTSEYYLKYLIDRLGVGQIQGVYEQLSLKIRDFDYIYAEIPFSGFFLEPKSFSKDLMLSTWSHNLHSNDTGVMNSFFIGESYAIGGFYMIFASCIAVAFNFCLISYIHVYALTKHFKIQPSDVKIVVPLYISSILTFTGDLGGLLFGKRVFILALFLMSLYAIGFVTSRKRPFPHN